MEYTGERLLDVHEVAELLHISVSTVRRRTVEGTLPAARFSRQCVRYRQADVTEYIASCVNPREGSEAE